MRYERVVLVSPRYDVGPNALADHPPSGLGYLSQALEDAHIDHMVIDQRVGLSDDDMLTRIAQYEPDLIGISMMTYLHQHTYATIRKVRAAWSRADIIVGGPHVSTLREAVLGECLEIDFGAVLEGEGTLTELCLGRSIESIEGLIHRDGDDVIFNGERPFQHLNDVAFPKYHRFEMDKYLTRMVPLVTSRGCPYSCIYCPVEKAIGKRFRLRNAENVVAEIEHWVDQGYSQYLILDDNFTLKTGRVEEICELIGAKGLDELDIGLPNGVRADRISRDLLKKMRSVGFSRLAFGVEAGNDKVLANINKGEKMIHIESAIADACDLGFKVTLFFIIGSPGETWADFMDSISLARRYPIDEARFYNLIPFPGTKLYDWVKDKGYLVRDYNEYLNSASHFVNSPCFETPDLSLSERKRAFKLASKTSRQVRRRSLTRKLSRLGPFAGPLAAAYTTSIVQRLSQASAPFKRLKSALNRDSDHLYQRKQENKLRNEARGMSRESSESQDGDRRTIV